MARSIVQAFLLLVVPATATMLRGRRMSQEDEVANILAQMRAKSHQRAEQRADQMFQDEMARRHGGRPNAPPDEDKKRKIADDDDDDDDDKKRRKKEQRRPSRKTRERDYPPYDYYHPHCGPYGCAPRGGYPQIYPPNYLPYYPVPPPPSYPQDYRRFLSKDSHDNLN